MSALTLFAISFNLPPAGVEQGSLAVFILNGTFFVMLAASMLWFWNWTRTRNLNLANTEVKNFLVSKPVILVLALGAIFNVSSAAYFAYEVPRDLMQDIQSAKLFWAGLPAFPLNMTPEIKDTIDHEPTPPSLGKWFPIIAEIEKKSYQDLVTDPWTQAHPATMTLLLASLVPWMHVRTITLLFSLMSIVSLFGTFWLLRRELASASAENSKMWLALTLGCLSWFPFWMVLRNGQVTFALTFLLTLSWYFLRHDRNVPAGIFLGLATALKLFPGFLIVYLLIRRRKAFWPAALTAGGLLAASFAIVGKQNTLDYLRVVRFVQDYYIGFRDNFSVQAVLVRLAPALEPRFHFAAILARLFFVASLCLLAWTVTRKSQDRSSVRSLDLEFALFMALAIVLSPVCWDNYLVLLIPPAVFLIFALREGSVLAENAWRTTGLLLTAAVLAVPQPFLTWMMRLLKPRYLMTIFFFKMPIFGVFGLLALLWGLRIQLARLPDARAFPPSEDSGTQERPVAA